MTTDLQLAKASSRDDLAAGAFDKAKFVMEPKIDGFRAGLRLESGKVTVYSRTHKTQAGKLPHIEAALAEVAHDFEIDGELVHLDRLVKTDQGLLPIGDFNRTMRVMGSLPAKAVAEQKDAPLVFLAFDIISLNGVDMRDRPESARREALEVVLVDIVRTPYIGLVPRLRPSLATYEAYCAEGGEGMMIKDTTARYTGKRSTAWLKVKVEMTEDAIVTGFKPGKGKYADTIGALVFSQYDASGNLVERGACSGMDDALRYDIGANPKKYLGKIVEVKHYGQATEADLEGLRHPTFVRFRDDKRAEDCTFEK